MNISPYFKLFNFRLHLKIVGVLFIAVEVILSNNNVAVVIPCACINLQGTSTKPAESELEENPRDDTGLFF